MEGHLKQVRRSVDSAWTRDNLSSVQIHHFAFAKNSMRRSLHHFYFAQIYKKPFYLRAGPNNDVYRYLDVNTQ